MVLPWAATALIPWLTILYALAWTVVALILAIAALLALDAATLNTKWCCIGGDTIDCIKAILAIAASAIAFVALVIAYAIGGVA
jgi:hypothetical protein